MYVPLDSIIIAFIKSERGGMGFMENTMHDVQAQIDGLLTSWAIKYNVTHDYHQRLVQKIKPLLEVLFEKVKKEDMPTWLKEKDEPFPDSFTYALNYAENSYMTMVQTKNNIDIIKKGLNL